MEPRFNVLCLKSLANDVCRDTHVKRRIGSGKKAKERSRLGRGGFKEGLSKGKDVKGNKREGRRNYARFRLQSVGTSTLCINLNAHLPPVIKTINRSKDVSERKRKMCEEIHTMYIQLSNE